MKYLRSIVTWIDSFEEGSQFSKWISILLKIFSVLTYIGTIVLTTWFLFGQVDAIRNWNTFSAVLMVIGLILALGINLFAGVVIAKLFWNRSNKINTLSSNSHFTLIPIAVILIRLIGEVGFIAYVVAGLQVLVTSIFRSGIPPLVDFFIINIRINADFGFITGIILFIISVLCGAFVFIFQYFIAELIYLFVDMATNLKKIETNLSSEETIPDSPAETTSDS